MRLLITMLRPFVHWLCRLFFRIEFHGAENVPVEGACIIAPNHVTYADPIWMTIPIRRRVYYMAWDKIFAIPGLGFLMRSFGAFPVNLERADASAQREAIEVLQSGRALVIFPEGGRTRTGKLMPFKMGAFRLALICGAPIVPVTIDGAYSIWPVGKIFPRPGRLTVTYHPPVPVARAPEGINRLELKELARELARETRAIVASALDTANLPEDADSTAASAKSNA